MEIHAVSFRIFGVNLSLYGLLFVAGFAIAIGLAFLNRKKYGISKIDIVAASCFAGVGALVGAKALALIVAIPEIVKGGLSFLDLMRGGFVFYGGLCGGALGLFIYCKSFKLPFAQFADISAPVTALGHAIGRIGCLFSGCCYGCVTDGPFWIEYKSSLDLNTPLNVHLVPAQLIEIIYLVVIFAVTETLLWKSKHEGTCGIVYALTYAAARFILEFWRADAERGCWGGLSTSQYISFAVFLLCYVILFIKVLKKYGCLKKKKQNLPQETKPLSDQG